MHRRVEGWPLVLPLGAAYALIGKDLYYLPAMARGSRLELAGLVPYRLPIGRDADVKDNLLRKSDPGSTLQRPQGGGLSMAGPSELSRAQWLIRGRGPLRPTASFSSTTMKDRDTLGPVAS
jgi:hypothetical protein